MADFLRKPAQGEPKDGDAYCQIVGSEVVAQVAKKKGEGVVCLEVRKSLVDKKGELLPKEKRHELIETTKEEVQKLYAKKK